MTTLNSITSYYSLMRGVHSPYDLCHRAATLGYTALALTDRNNLYGLPAFLKACNHFRLRPIIGAEITYNRGSILVYAQGREGFSSLNSIITEKQMSQSFNVKASLLANHRSIHGSCQLCCLLPWHYQY